MVRLVALAEIHHRRERRIGETAVEPLEREGDQVGVVGGAFDIGGAQRAVSYAAPREFGVGASYKFGDAR